LELTGASPTSEPTSCSALASAKNVRPFLHGCRQQGIVRSCPRCAGFAVKLYTKQGNWDLVGNNIPVFFIQDAIKFPDIIHAVKPEPDRAFPQAQSAHDNFWDFISLTPESMHMIMWVMSDRAIPRHSVRRLRSTPSACRQE
jgi:catalase